MGSDTHNERLVFLDDILGPEGFAGIKHNEGTCFPFPFIFPLLLIYEKLSLICALGWPSAGLRFSPEIDTELMLAKLVNASLSAKGGFHVYTNETMPDRFAFKGHHVSLFASLFCQAELCLLNREHDLAHCTNICGPSCGVGDFGSP